MSLAESCTTQHNLAGGLDSFSTSTISFSRDMNTIFSNQNLRNKKHCSIRAKILVTFKIFKSLHQAEKTAKGRETVNLADNKFGNDSSMCRIGQKNQYLIYGKLSLFMEEVSMLREYGVNSFHLDVLSENNGNN